MKGIDITSSLGQAGVFDTRPQTSTASLSGIHLQHPEPAAQRYLPRDRNAVPSQEPSAESSPNINFNRKTHNRSSEAAHPQSARSSRSSSGRQGSSASPRQGGRRLSPSKSTPDPRRLPQQSHHLNPHHSSLYDQEKAARSNHQVHSGSHRSHAFSTYVSEEEEDVKEHTVWILIYLSFFSPIVATCISIYALLTTFLLLLCSPVLYLSKTTGPLTQRFYASLTPPIHFQLGLVFSETEPDLDGIKPESYHTATSSNVISLIIIHIFSPAYAACIAVTAWIAAGFWATALVLGNPDGRDGRDDGKAVVLGVRKLWERWLRKGLR
ncbi:MAG: hypothetical protein Q9170_005638 [Blastenia crenularia]